MSYTPASSGTPANLTLNGYNYTGEGYKLGETGSGDTLLKSYAAIYANESLTITVNGTCNIKATTANSDDSIADGIHVAGNLTILGDGELTARSNGEGILAIGNLQINGGTVAGISQGSNSYCGIGAGGTVTINSGAVRAKAARYGIASLQGEDVVIKDGAVGAYGGWAGIYSTKNVTIDGGTVETASFECGVCGAEITIGESASVSSMGNEYAFAYSDPDTYEQSPAVVKNAVAGAGWDDYAGYGDREAIDVSEKGQDLSAYKNVQFPVMYPVWVGGKRVTEKNRLDVFGDGKVSYVPATEGDDPTPAKLTLNGYSYTGAGYRYDVQYDYSDLEPGMEDEEPEPIWESFAAISAEEPLTLIVNGTNYLECTVADPQKSGCDGVVVLGDLTIDGEGELTAKGSYNGIYSSKNMRIVGGTLTAEATATTEGYCLGGLSADGSLSIDGGTVTASSDNNGIYCSGDEGITIAGGVIDATGGYDGIWAESNVTVSGGDVTTSGNDGCGIGGAEIAIGADVTSIVSSGTVYAFGFYDGESDDYTSTTVKNSLAGTGWSNTEGTMDETAIEANEEGQDLATYKRVQFPPPHTHVFSCFANGATITAICSAEDCPLDDGQGNHSATLTIKAPATGVGAAVLESSPEGAFGDLSDSVRYQTKTGGTWGSETADAPTESGFYKANITVAGSDNNSATASVTYGVNCISYATGLKHGTVNGDANATCGATITPTITPEAGYELDTLTVTPEEGAGVGVDDVKVDGGTFVMPEANVTVSAKFSAIDYTLTLTQPGSGGTVEASKTKALHVGDSVTLSAHPDDGYMLREFEVTDAAGNNVAVDGGTFVMPASDVTVTASFGMRETYTIFYRAAGNPESVKFKMASDEDGGGMANSAMLGNINCWAVQITAAQGRDKFPIAFSTDGGSTWSELTDRDVASDIPADLAEGGAVVVRGEARAFILSFLWGDIQRDSVNGGYKAADGESKNFLVTNTTTSVLVPDPTKADHDFLGWDDGKGEGLRQSVNGVVDVSGIGETTIFAARWKPSDCKVTYDLNGGAGNVPSATVAHGSQLNAPAAPSKSGYTFVRWVVAERVTEEVGGREQLLSTGTEFDFSNTKVTNDLKLKAEWKHVHSYVCLQLDDPLFNGAFSKYYDYRDFTHVKMCTSADNYTIEAHSYNANGECACGVRRPEPKVTLTRTVNGVTSTTRVAKDSVVCVCAPTTGDGGSFFKWEYRDGTSWRTLGTTPCMAFVIPSDLQLRAVYKAPAAELSVESFIHSGHLAFQFAYSVPKGLSVVDAGLLAGGNGQIRYIDAKQLRSGSGLGDIMFPYIPRTEMPINYVPATDNVIEKYGVDAVRNKVFREEAINVSGSSNPLFKKCVVVGNVGAAALALNTSSAGAYYYGMGYVLCKDPAGSVVVFMTDPIWATKNDPNHSAASSNPIQ
ncbi:MAG: carbohydrate-binding domain-containing protein [Coriobacteriales bacterium]|nr:carbohydrate-binding domain-containing protein [Coriobacteriales bacterium]